MLHQIVEEYRVEAEPNKKNHEESSIYNRTFFDKRGYVQPLYVMSENSSIIKLQENYLSDYLFQQDNPMIKVVKRFKIKCNIRIREQIRV